MLTCGVGHQRAVTSEHYIVPCSATESRCMLCRLQPISCLSALTCFKMQHCHGIRKSSDLAPLAALSKLGSLDLCGCSNLQGSGMSSLAALTALK